MLNRKIFPSDTIDLPAQRNVFFNTNYSFTKDVRIKTACLLAAGTGSRLRHLTNSSPKCLTQINGVSILERLIHSLQQQGFKKLIVVVGHFESCLLKFLDDHKGDLVIETIINPLYASTNNIYSLWLARNIIQEPFLLLESDLIFETTFLEEMLEPDKIAVSRVKPWMNMSPRVE
jgi:choline kinase